MDEEYVLRLAFTQWRKDCFGPPVTARKRTGSQKELYYTVQL
jgi:hypothetical protein